MLGGCAPMAHQWMQIQTLLWCHVCLCVCRTAICSALTITAKTKAKTERLLRDLFVDRKAMLPATTVLHAFASIIWVVMLLQLERKGVPVPEDGGTISDPDLLMEVMEQRERIEETDDPAVLQTMLQENKLLQQATTEVRHEVLTEYLVIVPSLYGHQAVSALLCCGQLSSKSVLGCFQKLSAQAMHTHTAQSRHVWYVSGCIKSFVHCLDTSMLAWYAAMLLTVP